MHLDAILNGAREIVNNALNATPPREKHAETTIMTDVGLSTGFIPFAPQYRASGSAVARFIAAFALRNW